ncbi:Nonribosomal peptide synthetase [Lachnellula willkommii]|uniref:Nonribosomal peptide synthetase n=1 Tax=Lachnellula willkommii TaxID=215461 RepID=A0A559MFU4_9HELO|nr:Nonribosomal peptide synthetase [Lachnellula willkommii]
MTPATPEPQRSTFTSNEHRLHCGAPLDEKKTEILFALAWTVLAIAYSENKQTNVNFLETSGSHSIVSVFLQAEAEQPIEELKTELSQKLSVAKTKNQAAINGKESKQNKSALPKTLLTGKVDGAIQSIIQLLIQGTSQASNYALVIGIESEQSHDGSLVLKGFYNGNELDNHEVKLILDRVGSLITQIAADECKYMKDLDLLSTSDREQLRIWNTDLPPGLNTFAHKLIELRAMQYPQNEAVCAWDGSFTYEELGRRASNLAKLLVVKGVHVGDYVPLMFEKSKWHIVSLLAILKAGAAFAALEHSIPEGRIQIILDQIGHVPLMLASTTQAKRMQKYLSQVIKVDEETTSSDAPNITLPVAGEKDGPQLNHPAYVIFTSGSTDVKLYLRKTLGIPKGAIIEHVQLSTSMQALNDNIGFTADMRKLQMTAFNFDLSLSEIFCPLLAGGCICMPSEWSRFNDLGGAVESLNANFGSFSPSFLATLSEKEFSKLKTILLAGERVPTGLTNFWTNHGRRMLHMYGPTECTVGCCFLDANAQPHYDGFIGDAYGSKIWIVDPEDHEKLMPIGAPGEFVVEGPIVGRCYLADPERTQNTFLRRPSWFPKILEREPDRFYRTGDLGRLTKSGAFEIFGRKDTQTKIRGLRVEIQEIEHQIREACEANIKVAVEVRNPTLTPGQEMLVAFLEMKTPQADSPKATSLNILWDEFGIDTRFSRTVQHIESKLREVLPNYMMPSVFVPISLLPFSNSYKLDRRILKERANMLELSEIQKALCGKRTPKQGTPPLMTEAQKILRNIWAKVLYVNAETLSLEQDFFLSGGDSLKAIALVSMARRKGIHFSVTQLYKFRTIAELTQLGVEEEAYEDSHIEALSMVDATCVEQLREIAVKQCGIGAESIQDIMPVTDMQNFYLSRQRERPFCWQIPVGFDLPEGIDSARLRRAWEEILAHYPITRTRFINAPMGIFQVVLKQETVHWRQETMLAEFLSASAKDDLSFGHRTHQSALTKASEHEPSRLIWYVNHAIADHIMDEMLAQELSNLYRGSILSLPKHRSFKSAIHHRLTRDPDVSQAYWRTHLTGATYKPLFGASTSMITPAFAASRSCISASAAAPPWLNVSAYAFTLTAWALALSEFAGAADIPFFIIRTGRSSALPGSEHIIGPMLVRVPLRVCIAHDMGAADLLRQSMRA